MAITDLDEQLLVRAHQAGDERAFQQIVRSQHRALYAHAYRRLGNHESAEDAVQDTLLRAYRALPPPCRASAAPCPCAPGCPASSPTSATTRATAAVATPGSSIASRRSRS